MRKLFFLSCVAIMLVSCDRIGNDPDNPDSPAFIPEEVRQQIFATNPSRLSRYLTETFKEDLEYSTPSQLIESYGTHVLTQVYLGYAIRKLYRSIVLEKGSLEKINSAFEGMGIRANSIYEQDNIKITYDEQMANRNYGGAILVEFAGGDFTKLPYIQLTPNEVVGKPVNITPWHKSKEPSNWTLVSLKGEGVVPIYELIADPVKKQQVKEAVIAYIKEKQVKFTRTAPIIQAWNGKQHRYFKSVEELNKAANDYAAKGVIGSVFLNADLDTQPLCLLSDGKSERLSIQDSSPENKEMANKGIFGYVYKEYPDFVNVSPKNSHQII